MTSEPHIYRTKTGRILTDADIQALADEAECGYSVEHLARRSEIDATAPAGTPVAATQLQRRELAATIAQQAQALADGKVTGPEFAAVRRLLSNAELLAAWTPDDRSGLGR